MSSSMRIRSAIIAAAALAALAVGGFTVAASGHTATGPSSGPDGHAAHSVVHPDDWPWEAPTAPTTTP